MVKGGVTTSINTKHQCITAMKEYENKSLEVERILMFNTEMCSKLCCVTSFNKYSFVAIRN